MTPLRRALAAALLLAGLVGIGQGHRSSRGRSAPRFLQAPRNASVRGPMFRSSRALGVHHFVLPGQVPGNQGRNESVIMYIFLKGMRQGSDVRWRGIAYTESVERELYVREGGGQLSQTPLIEFWKPRFYLKSLKDNSTIDIPLFTWMVSRVNDQGELRFANPFILDLTMTSAALESHGAFELRVDAWKNCDILSPGLAHVPAPEPLPPPPGAIPETVVVLTPFYLGTPRPIAAAIVWQYVRYHVAFGVDRIVQITDAVFLEAFLADARLAHYVAEGRLEFVLWESTPACIQGGGPYAYVRCYQGLMNNVYLLAAWGHNAYVHFLDQDEYLVTTPRRPTWRMKDIVRGCYGSMGQLRIQRFDVYCSDCAEWQPIVNENPEQEAWLSERAAHPLLRYGLRRRESYSLEFHGKAAVRPEAVAAFDIHRGAPFKGEADDGEATEDECGAFVAHAVNMHSSRSRPPASELRRDDSWHGFAKTLSERRPGAPAGPATGPP